MTASTAYATARAEARAALTPESSEADREDFYIETFGQLCNGELGDFDALEAAELSDILHDAMDAAGAPRI